jgi:4-hydroxy-tetrahydrodipicolinate synthase
MRRNMNWTCTVRRRQHRGMTSAAQPPAGLFVPLVTPFTESGELDPAGLESLAHRVLDEGATGIVALGTTAEAPTLTGAERRRVLDICAQVCAERSAPLIAGAGGNDTRASADALRELAAWPQITAALVVVPYYLRPGEEGAIAHFEALARRTPVPLVVYNIPARTGQRVSWPAMRRIASLPAVVGVKHSPGAVDLDTAEMMADLPAGFSVLSGDCFLMPALLALGAAGAISASAHICTRSYADLVTAWRDGEVAAARPLGHRLTALSARLFAEPNPAVIKAVLHGLGHIASPAVRLPLLAAQPSSASAALAAAAELAGLAA